MATAASGAACPVRARGIGGQGWPRGTGEQVVTQPGRSYCGLVYDYDLEEVELLGWEGFIAVQWESIFIGYRSWVGRRGIARRWSDLFEVGLGCPQEVADWLARAEIMDRADRDLEGAADAEALVSGMIGVVADVRADLAEMSAPGSGFPGKILDQHARLLSFVRAQAAS